MYFQLIRCQMKDPGDVSELSHLLATKQVKPEEIKGIIAQPEGDNYARGYATLAFQCVLSEALGWTKEEVFEKIPMMMIGKTGGLMTPHYTLFIKRQSEQIKQDNQKRFAFGTYSTRALLPEEIGTVVQVDLVAEGVKKALVDAGIDSIEDVHCVEVKVPWGVGGTRSKGTSALGVAVALGEVERSEITDSAIGAQHSLYTQKGSVSAGHEQIACRIIVMGNSNSSTSPHVIGSGVMQDALDLEGLLKAFQQVGLNPSPLLTKMEQSKIVQLFINAGADALPTIRGRRHTMHSDALAMHSGVLAKAVVNSVVGSFVGETAILCSAGSEHQGPQGANLVAIVVNNEEGENE